MVLPEYAAGCSELGVRTYHTLQSYPPSPSSSAEFPAILGTGLHRGAMDLQRGNHQSLMCRIQLMGREALQHVLQTVANAQHGCNAMGVQRVIAACAHENTDTHSSIPTGRHNSQGLHSVPNCTTAAGTSNIYLNQG